MNASSDRNDLRINLNEFYWINQPKVFSLGNDSLTISTDPETDYWQRTHYGFQKNNGHTFITDLEADFTFQVKAFFSTVNQYDQCGIILYHTDENWVKASVEHENNEFARLGSVVTNLGYSDWASTNITSAIRNMWYRFSRRGQDFYIEYSFDGQQYQQMRMFHLHLPVTVAKVGVYACSPLKSSFSAVFSCFQLDVCKWPIQH